MLQYIISEGDNILDNIYEYNVTLENGLISCLSRRRVGDFSGKKDLNSKGAGCTHRLFNEVDDTRAIARKNTRLGIDRSVDKRIHETVVDLSKMFTTVT